MYISLRVRKCGFTHASRAEIRIFTPRDIKFQFTVAIMKVNKVGPCTLQNNNTNNNNNNDNNVKKWQLLLYKKLGTIIFNNLCIFGLKFFFLILIIS